MGCSGLLWDVPGVFRGCSGLFRAVPGCSGGVPGVFRGVPGVFRGVPGCSGVFRGVPVFRVCSGFYRHPFKISRQDKIKHSEMGQEHLIKTITHSWRVGAKIMKQSKQVLQKIQLQTANRL